MIDLFKGFFKKESSSQTAKERLRLVLMTDHLSLAPDVIEAMKADILAVLSRYVEIDPAHADVTFESRDREVAMLASIPILALRDRGPRPPTGGGGSRASGGGNAAAPPREEPQQSSAVASAVANAETARAESSAAVPARPPRRRRRRHARVTVPAGA